MLNTLRKPTDQYSPLYFLTSLGAGGLTVSFFMYLMFWVPHPGRVVPVFEDVATAFAAGNPAQQAAIIIAYVGIAVFTVLNIRYLLWNFRALAQFKRTEAYQTLRRSNAETALLAGPLATAMTVNAMFIVGLTFVPGLWTIVEYLFPAALVAFAIVGIWAFRLIGGFLGRVFASGGGFDLAANNSFAQALPAFAISMVGVGFAAPAAMSTSPAIVAVALVLSTLFAIAAILYTAVAVLAAIGPILSHGTAKEAAPTLMILVPIVTILSILLMRQTHGLHTTFDVHASAGETMTFLTRMIAVQVLFLMLGVSVLRRQGYFQSFVFGSETSPGSYALVCPGVAFSVLFHFFINKGLVAAGVIAKFGMIYWGLSAIAVVAQLMMIALVLRLNSQHFTSRGPDVAVPAE